MRCLASLTALILALVGGAARLSGQRELSGAARVRQSLDRLGVLGSVLMIAAHPDDENTALLAYFARGRHLRTGYLSLTRGEGGQNFIGPEQGEALGVIRTQELLAARRIDGAEQYFSRAIDFGYTKSADETLAKWGREQVLSDVVWNIRRFRPDVIVLRFSGTPRDGHGQHQASAILGKEAFSAAADPKRFPEQLQWVQPWQARRLVWNTFAFNRQQQRESEMLPNKVEVDAGQYNPVLGYSYAEIAGMSRSEHRSQAMGSPERKGPSKNFLVPVAGEPATDDLFDGIDLTWGRIPGAERARALIAEASAQFDAAHPEGIVPKLVEARSLIESMKDPWARRKAAEIDDTIALCAGLWMDANAESGSVVPGRDLKVTTSTGNRSTLPLRLERIELAGAVSVAESVAVAMGENALISRTITPRIPEAEPLSQPYWLRKPREGDLYSVPDQQLIGLPQTPPPLSARFVYRLGGKEFTYTVPVEHRFVDALRGERTEPLAIVPPVAVRLPETAVVFPSAATRPVEVRITAGEAGAKGEVRLKAPQGWKVEPEVFPFRLAAAGEQQTLVFQVTPPAREALAQLAGEAKADGFLVTTGIQPIVYSHIPPQTLFPAAEAKMVRSDIQNLAHRVGYIMGPGDDMPDALRQLGCDVTLIDRDLLATGDLSRFDAIVTGVRAHSARPDLQANRQRLLDYVSEGGTLVVQYNRTERGFGPKDTIAPYPITVGMARVSVEDAPVEVLNPGSPVLRAPNTIKASDFEGWVQERGLYFSSQWDPRYQVLFTSHDPNEPPLGGGALFTPYGKGAYIFTAYAWFRQLPAGVPGAYRIFANFISAGKVLQNAPAATH